jgi:diguanylate cyclase
MSDFIAWLNMSENRSTRDPWVQKYRYTLQLLERKEKSWKKREGILKLIASWLVLAADHRDEALNEELQELRSALRNDRSDDSLRAMVDRLSTSIARLNKSRSRVATDEEIADEIAQSLDHLNSASDLNHKIKALVEKIRSCEQRGDKQSIIKAFTAFIIELVKLIPKDRTFAQSDNNDSHFKNETVSDAKTSPSPQIHTVLIQLLYKLDFPQEIRTQADVIAERMRQGIPAEQIGSYITEIVDLITQLRLVVQAEKQDIERFLERLASQLQDFEVYIGGAVVSERQVSEHRKNFNNTLDNQMREIETTLHDAADLVTVKSAIQVRLDVIQRHLEEDRKIEAERGRHAEAEIERLKSQLKATENVTDSLRERLRQEHEQAIKDPLTGLFNRIAYEERLQQEYKRWKRYKRPSSLVVIDVDHFKRVNDTYGHNAGDRVLMSLAELFQRHIRTTDLLVRFGGEEFVIVASETTAEEALMLAEKLRKTVDLCNFYYEGRLVPVTISCGVSSLRDSDTPEQVFKRADKALYRAKEQGRNRCSSE